MLASVSHSVEGAVAAARLWLLLLLTKVKIATLSLPWSSPRPVAAVLASLSNGITEFRVAVDSLLIL